MAFFRMGLTKPLGLPGLACGFFVSGKTAFNRQLFRAETCETFIHTNGQMCFFDQTKIGRRTPAMFFFCTGGIYHLVPGSMASQPLPFRRLGENHGPEVS